MNVWVDAQLSPTVARWMSDALDIHAVALRDVGLRDADDVEIFHAAGERHAVTIIDQNPVVRKSPVKAVAEARAWLERVEQRDDLATLLAQ